MRSVFIMILAAFSLTLLAHAHCRVEMCVGDEHSSALSVAADNSTELPCMVCATEIACPAKESSLRVTALAAPASQPVAEFVHAVSTDELSARSIDLASLSSKNVKLPLFTLYQTFRI